MIFFTTNLLKFLLQFKIRNSKIEVHSAQKKSDLRCAPNDSKMTKNQKKEEKINMGKNTKIVGGVLLVVIILVAVAYAAITNVELNINGLGNAQAKQDNIKVEFI